LHPSFAALFPFFKNAICVVHLPHVVVQMGKVFAAREELDSAIATYCDALGHSPENPELLTNLGLLYLRWVLGALVWLACLCVPRCRGNRGISRL
jgi:hypothetical protein